MSDKKVYLFPNWRNKEAYGILKELSELTDEFANLLMVTPKLSIDQECDYQMRYIRLGERAKDLLEKENK